MLKYKVYLKDEHKDCLIKYICNSGDTFIMCSSFVAVIIFLVIFSIDTSNIGVMDASDVLINQNFIFSLFWFVTEFRRCYGKTFGYKCDLWCVKKDLYTLHYGAFVYRDKNPHNKPPYCISDKSYTQYYMPTFS